MRWAVLAVVATVVGPLSGAPGAIEDPPPGMVWVPAGEFTMGWNGPDGCPDERPSDRVHVSGFWMDVTEVTNAKLPDTGMCHLGFRCVRPADASSQKPTHPHEAEELE